MCPVKKGSFTIFLTTKFFPKPSKEIEIATSEITTTFLILEPFDALSICSCVYKNSCLSLGWLVSWSVNLLRKFQNRAKLSILASIFILVTFSLSFTFIYFHLPSFTFNHFHSLPFTLINIHASIHNVHL